MKTEVTGHCVCGNRWTDRFDVPVEIAKLTCSACGSSDGIMVTLVMTGPQEEFWARTSDAVTTATESTECAIAGCKEPPPPRLALLRAVLTRGDAAHRAVPRSSCRR
jgi:hypothetical protein